MYFPFSTVEVTIPSSQRGGSFGLALDRDRKLICLPLPAGLPWALLLACALSRLETRLLYYNKLSIWLGFNNCGKRCPVTSTGMEAQICRKQCPCFTLLNVSASSMLHNQCAVLMYWSEGSMALSGVIQLWREGG